MAIRIREIEDKKARDGFLYKALCAAKSEPKKGDIYLNDAIHSALSNKFWEDFKPMGFIRDEKR